MNGTPKQTAVVTDIAKQLHEAADPEYALKCRRFFKTGPGEYAEHDKFLGIRVPALRALATEYKNEITLEECCILLQNEWHEYRLFALLTMAALFQRGDEDFQQKIVSAYFRHIKHINNWDLVDSSAYKIPGPWFFDKGRCKLHRMIKAKSLWERRIPMLSTLYYIRHGDLDDTFAYALQLLDDPEDLIHKATGWMLREAGKRDEERLLIFLKTHHRKMPRTMFSYATEKLSNELKSHFNCA